MLQLCKNCSLKRQKWSAELFQCREKKGNQSEDVSCFNAFSIMEGPKEKQQIEAQDPTSSLALLRGSEKPHFSHLSNGNYAFVLHHKFRLLFSYSKWDIHYFFSWFTVPQTWFSLRSERCFQCSHWVLRGALRAHGALAERLPNSEEGFSPCALSPQFGAWGGDGTISPEPKWGSQELPTQLPVGHLVGWNSFCSRSG